ncbi:hypothetical protein ACCT21_37305, partial [Rhizobium brockwellii]
HLHRTSVLATVASAMTISTLYSVEDSPRMRVHSFAVCTTVVFLLNEVAFMLMGLQSSEQHTTEHQSRHNETRFHHS